MSVLDDIVAGVREDLARRQELVSLDELKELQTRAAQIYVDPALISWAVDVATATRSPRNHGLSEIADYIAFGASPRGPIAVAMNPAASTKLAASTTPEQADGLRRDLNDVFVAVQLFTYPGDYLRDRLRDLSDQSSQLGGVRGRGLIAGVDTYDPSGAVDRASSRGFLDGLLREGVLAGLTGPEGNVLKIRPPLVWESEHVDVLIEALRAVLADTLERLTRSIR